MLAWIIATAWLALGVGFVLGAAWRAMFENGDRRESIYVDERLRNHLSEEWLRARRNRMQP